MGHLTACASAGLLGQIKEIVGQTTVPQARSQLAVPAHSR